uniref:Uncharacterized protein n=1 Tax=Brassica oleracea var. oleracea TaxID=109376 RepID=A0A0D3AW86_BRAOL
MMCWRWKFCLDTNIISQLEGLVMFTTQLWLMLRTGRSGLSLLLLVSHRVWRGVSASCKLLAGVCSRNSPKKKDRGGCVSSQRKLSNEIHQKKHKHGGSIMGSRDRNHSSNATGDISVTTQSEERKQCSFNAYLYNQPTGSATYVRQTELSLTA